MFWSLFTFSLIGIVSIQCMSTKDKCDLRKVDRCAQILYIYGDPTYKVSNNIQEAHQFCK